ncbi:YqjF family protein [Lysinibacillus antri]|uniref:DUF2071 domain-containing protein n=1 Tax=Lysinibacillus antri TaxID=2498145 RepID=A0A432L9N0_9BACI|nr:DUF2071 domain-containing protein [Lysinibacillus antri]RUL49875.1 DUF2071 domain-containing protein [Lysinibacillus antri]
MSNYNSQKFNLPSFPWIMKQTWSENLFVHYPVKKEHLQKLIPKPLQLDTYDNRAWVSIVPYFIQNMRGHGMPAIPGTKEFAGFNLRTYVRANEKPGVYFFHLGASNWFATKGAKTFFQLPYFYEDIRMDKEKEMVHFQAPGKLVCAYKGASKPYHPSKGSLDEWLVERYCLYTTNQKGKLFQGNILHPSWVLYDAEAEFQENTLLSRYNITPESDRPILHFAHKREVAIWPLVSPNQ